MSCKSDQAAKITKMIQWEVKNLERPEVCTFSGASNVFSSTVTGCEFPVTGDRKH